MVYYLVIWSHAYDCVQRSYASPAQTKFADTTHFSSVSSKGAIGVSELMQRHGQYVGNNAVGNNAGQYDRAKLCLPRDMPELESPRYHELLSKDF